MGETIARQFVMCYWQRVRTDAAIGVFDSGLGGLSVLKELKRRLPGEDFIYLGDVARLPYGTKSQAVVERYALQCLDFLKSKKVKMVVVACNTATATALPILRKHFDGVFGVIEAGVTAALKETQSGFCLVLGTESTIRSEAYLKEFNEQSPKTVVSTLSCPLLVPLAEEGWFEHPVTEEVIRSYLRKVTHPFDTILLGCTHYPLLRGSFEKATVGKVKLVDSAVVLSESVNAELSARGLKSTRAQGSVKFYATDKISHHGPIVESLFGDSAAFEVVDL